jgi:hypothetical protein
MISMATARLPLFGLLSAAVISTDQKGVRR